MPALCHLLVDALPALLVGASLLPLSEKASYLPPVRVGASLFLPVRVPAICPLLEGASLLLLLENASYLPPVSEC
jgi:hypothetical protein